MSEFIIDIASEIYGCKENLEVRFLERPQLGELRSKAESLFQNEATIQRPPGASIQHIRIVNFQIYDDSSRIWKILESSGQLQPYAQLYAFQEEATDFEDQIPTSSPPRSRIVVPEASPQRDRSGPQNTLREIKMEVSRSPRAVERIRQQQYAEPVPGESLIAEERKQESSRDDMDLDYHREMVRRETHDFLAGKHQ